MPKGRIRKQGIERMPEDTQEVVRTLLSGIEDEWLMARIRGETESTERLLDDSYQGSTSDGLSQTKADFLQSIESCRNTFTYAEHNERSIRIHGDTAISLGVATLTSADRRISFRYVRVFFKDKGQWRLVASQSTRVPGSLMPQTDISRT